MNQLNCMFQNDELVIESRYYSKARNSLEELRQMIDLLMIFDCQRVDLFSNLENVDHQDLILFL